MLRLFVCAAVGFVVAASPAKAQDVLVSPTSVVFEDGERGGQFIVGNTGDVTSLFSLELAYFRMDPSGQRVEIQQPFPENSAADLIRFSPRQFELAPGSSQVVRMATRIPESLPDGEYRIHLRVTNKGEAVMQPEIRSDDDGNLTVAIKIEVSRAIRVLVRKGVTAGRASLLGVTAKPISGSRWLVSAELERFGAGSSSGQYRIYTRGSGDNIAGSGVLIYSELGRRTIEETVPAGSVRPGVDLCIAYRDETAPKGQEEERCVRPG